MVPESAQLAVHDRARLAFDAAAIAGLPGTFVAFERAGLFATLTTAPEMSYLNLISGVSAESFGGVLDLLESYQSAGAESPSLVAMHQDPTIDGQLRSWGFRPAGHRPIASLALSLVLNPTGVDRNGGLTVNETEGLLDLGVFLDVLRAGYDVPVAVSQFMAAEHSVGSVRRFVAQQDGEAVAVAAMSVHRGVAVLGGATVLPNKRGQGLQMVLLRHRLLAAQVAGCDLAVATAAPDSASLTNLERAGFTVDDRRSWQSTRGHFLSSG